MSVHLIMIFKAYIYYPWDLAYKTDYQIFNTCFRNSGMVGSKKTSQTMGNKEQLGYAMQNAHPLAKVPLHTNTLRCSFTIYCYRKVFTVNKSCNDN